MGYLLSLRFFCCGIPKSHISYSVAQRELTVTKKRCLLSKCFFGEILNGQHSRNRPRPTKAEGASVFSFRFFDGFHSRRGVSKNRFSKSRPSVRPGAHSPRIGRFRLTKSDGFPEETHSILETVFALKSVDLFSRKGNDAKKSLPPVKAVFFCGIHNRHISCRVAPTGATKHFLLRNPNEG